MANTVEKVATRVGVGTYEMDEGITRFKAGLSIPTNVPADRGPELERDVRRVVEVVKEVTDKWSNK